MEDSKESTTPSLASAVSNLVRRKLLFGTIAVFVVTSCVCGFFTLATFDKLYSQTRLDQQVYAGQTLRDELLARLCPDLGANGPTDCPELPEIDSDPATDALLAAFVQARDWRPIQELPGPRGSLEREERPSAFVVSPQGRVLFSSDERLRGQEVPPINGTATAGGAATYLKQEGWYTIALPIHKADGTAAGRLVMKMPERVRGARVEELLQHHKKVLLVVVLSGVGLLTLLIGITVPTGFPRGMLPTKRITTITVTLVCAAQISAALGGAVLFRDSYPQLSWERTEALAQVLKAKLEERLDERTTLEAVLVRAKSTAMNTDSPPGRRSGAEQPTFAVSPMHDNAVYRVRLDDGKIISAAATPMAAFAGEMQDGAAAGALELPLRNGGKIVGILSARSNAGEARKILAGIGVEVLMTVVISMLCLVELLLLVFKYLERRIAAHQTTTKVHYGAMRPTIFLFLFGIDLSAALIPLQMERLYEPILNLPKDVVLGLPVSAMFLMVGVTFLIAGAWMDRRGWHEPFLIGVLLTGASKFYAWLAPDAIHFILAMAGIGFGYGLALMAAQGFVMANTTDRDKAHGIAYFFAGVYAGSIGGTAIGAMLAERIGYDLVFLIGSVFIFVSFGYGVLLLRRSFHKPEVEGAAQGADPESSSGFISFLLDRNVWSLILFCSIPSAVAVIGFLNYFSPVYLSRLGVTESIIGGVLTLYGISMVYVSPLVSKGVDATERKDLFILAGCALGGCAFLSFFVFSGLLAVVLAILFLGLSMSCLQSSQTTYTLKLEATRKFGSGKAVAMVRASSRIGQMLGPMVFSWLVMADDTEQAVTYFGVAYLVIAILFITLSRREDLKSERAQRCQELTEPGKAGG